jgi:hypothetical protein
MNDQPGRHMNLRTDASAGARPSCRFTVTSPAVRNNPGTLKFENDAA